MMKKPRSYIYDIGDIVNNSLIITKRTTDNHNHKAYMVKSLKFPREPSYRIAESRLKNGAKDSYTTKNRKRICLENSLYSIENTRKYLVDTEEAKGLAKYSKKNIEIYCASCSDIFKIRADRLNKEIPYCVVCHKNTSYPELFMLAYLKYLKIDFEYQKEFIGLENKKVDFYIESLGAIETHGEIHFSDMGSYMSHKRSLNSDKEKRRFFKENNIRLIELDCRKCSFDYIKNSINTCPYLPSIKIEDETQISKIISKNEKYPTRKIIDMYTRGCKIKDIAKECNMSVGTVYYALEKTNIKLKTKG